MANGKSVLGIIAADIRYSDQCAVRVSGADEHSAHAALRQFVAEALPLCDVPLAVSAAPIRSNTPPRPLKAAGVSCSFGVPVSRGIAHGKVVIVSRMTLSSSLSTPNKTDSQKELDHIKDAVAAVRRRIGEKLKYSITPAGTAVLQADLAMASDVFLVEKLTEQVLRGKSAGQAVVETGEFFIDLLRHSDNEYVRERSSDIEEICLQLLEEIYGASPGSAPVALHEPSVVVAETLAPQQLLELDRRWLKALVLEYSGSTSHAAILARSLGIPTLVGVRNARLVLPPGSEVVVDANRGLVVSYSLASVQRFYGREQQTLQRRRELWSRKTEKPAI